MPVSLNQYLVRALKYNNFSSISHFQDHCFLDCNFHHNFSSISHFQDHCFLDCNFHHNDIRFIFFLIFLMLLTLKRKTCKSTIYFSVLPFLTIGVSVSIAAWVYSILISLSGDVQLNPGRKNKSDVNFSKCHWNLNSILAHNCAKVFLVKAYIAVCL